MQYWVASMSNTILFSVIIPTYNRADFLKRALESLLKQTCRNFEVLVCDDGSTDDTADVVDQYRSAINVTYIRDDNWGGPARPRNHGIKRSVGEWICFLDSDDWWYPTKLECCMSLLKKADVIYHGLDVYSIAGKIRKMRLNQPKNPITQYLLTEGNKMPNSSVVIRKSVIDKIGFQLEDREVISSEDYEYLLRVSTVTDKFYFIPKMLGGYWKGENISADMDRHLRSEKNVIAFYFQYLDEFIQNEIHCRHLYVLARDLQKKRKYSKAINLFKGSIGAHVFTIKFKSIAFIIVCFLSSLVDTCKKVR